MAEMIDLGKKIRAADVVFTAEGRMDQQSLHGKVPLGVAQLCQKNNRPCFGLAGSIDPAIIPQCYEKGFAGVFPIQMGPLPLEESINKAEILLANTAENAQNVPKNRVPMITALVFNDHWVDCLRPVN